MVLGACSNNANPLNSTSDSQKEEEHTSHTSSKLGDIREETVSRDVLLNS